MSAVVLAANDEASVTRDDGKFRLRGDERLIGSRVAEIEIYTQAPWIFVFGAEALQVFRYGNGVGCGERLALDQMQRL